VYFPATEIDDDPPEQGPEFKPSQRSQTFLISRNDAKTSAGGTLTAGTSVAKTQEPTVKLVKENNMFHFREYDADTKQ
jgi:hypothetical protein